jgi:molybdate transport system substrate-binding protein
MKRLPFLALALLLIAGCAARTSAPTTKVVIFAAASTKDALETIAKDFQAAVGVELQVVPGPSSGLARQIEQTEKADLFLSADVASVDYLADKGLVAERRNLLTNHLVLIAPADSTLKIDDLRDLADAKIGRIALAEPKVPAGEYARDALIKSGVWEKIEAKVVGGIDVRATLQFIARGEADAGIVYRTDTIGNSKVRVVLEIPDDLHRPIIYPLVLLKSAANHDAAKRACEYLASEPALAAFRRAQFGIAP